MSQDCANCPIRKACTTNGYTGSCPNPSYVTFYKGAWWACDGQYGPFKSQAAAIHYAETH